MYDGMECRAFGLDLYTLDEDRLLVALELASAAGAGHLQKLKLWAVDKGFAVQGVQYRTASHQASSSDAGCGSADTQDRAAARESLAMAEGMMPRVLMAPGEGLKKVMQRGCCYLKWS